MLTQLLALEDPLPRPRIASQASAMVGWMHDSTEKPWRYAMDAARLLA
jgi:hypothetical protein